MAIIADSVARLAAGPSAGAGAEHRKNGINEVFAMMSWFFRTGVLRIGATLSLLGLAASSAAALECSAEKGVDLLLRDARVVDVRAGRVLPAQNVLVDEGVICAISRPGSDSRVTATRVVDAASKFLLPGLMEMHGHVSDAEAMTLYLANGVTTVRNLWGEQYTLELRDWLEARSRQYPRLITAGPIVDGSPPVNYPFTVVTDIQAAEKEVARQAALGYDFVKIYSNLSPTVFDAMIAAGEKYDMEISGHLPHDVTFSHALDAGMRSMEHFLEAADELLRYPPTPDLDLYVVYPETQALLEAIGRGELSIDDVVDRSRIPVVAEHAAASNTWIDPTLMPMRNFTSEWNRNNDAWHRYLSPATKAYWERAWAAREGWSKAARRGEDILFKLRLELLGALHEAGTPVLAGTDAPVPGMYHGFSLVDEIEYLTRAGLSNADALRAATLEAARYLEREGELGEVVAGAEADLLLIEGNPLEDLQNLRSIVGVLRAGEWHPRPALQQRLDRIAAGYSAQEALFDGAPGFAENKDRTAAEVVRTTAVKVDNRPVDFVSADHERAARLVTDSDEDGRTVRLALRDAEGGWRQASIDLGEMSVKLSLARGVELTLTKEQDVWVLRRESEELWRLASTGIVLPLTGTPADLAIFGSLSEELGSAELPLHVWACNLEGDCDGPPAAAYARYAGFEKINAVFAGTDHIELSVRGNQPTHFWIGAGPFYSGQPVRMARGSNFSWDRLR